MNDPGKTIQFFRNPDTAIQLNFNPDPAEVANIVLQLRPSNPSCKDDVLSFFSQEAKARTPNLNLSNAGFNFG